MAILGPRSSKRKKISILENSKILEFLAKFEISSKSAEDERSANSIETDQALALAMAMAEEKVVEVVEVEEETSVDHNSGAMTGALRRFLIRTFGERLLLQGQGQGTTSITSSTSSTSTRAEPCPPRPPCPSSGVLDVAGGKGQLSFELVNLHGIPSTVVDARDVATINYYKTVKTHQRLACKRRKAIARRKEKEEEEKKGSGGSDDESKVGGSATLHGLREEDIPYELPKHICTYWEPQLWRRILADTKEEEEEEEEEKEEKEEDPLVLGNGSGQGPGRQHNHLKARWKKAYGTKLEKMKERGNGEGKNTITDRVVGTSKVASGREEEAEVKKDSQVKPKVKEGEGRKGGSRASCPCCRFRGVSLDPESSKWRAKLGGQVLGVYATDVEAAKRFDEAMRGKRGADAMGVNFNLDGTENTQLLDKDRNDLAKKKKWIRKSSKSGKGDGKGDADDKGEEFLGCWRCGPRDQSGRERPKECQSIAEHPDGLSGWMQHKAFRCPLHNARAGLQMHPVELKGESEIRHILGNASIVVGLHPDQATGDIVDFALETKKPFAVVPCCTFAKTFQNRVLKCGDRVETYQQLIQWIREKDEGQIHLATLDAPGRNTVLYGFGAACPTACADKNTPKQGQTRKLET